MDNFKSFINEEEEAYNRKWNRFVKAVCFTGIGFLIILTILFLYFMIKFY